MTEVRVQSLLCDAEGTGLELLVIHRTALGTYECQTCHDGDGDDTDSQQRSQQRGATTAPRDRIGQPAMIGHLTGLFLKKIAVVIGAASGCEAPVTG